MRAGAYRALGPGRLLSVRVRGRARGRGGVGQDVLQEGGPPRQVLVLEEGAHALGAGEIPGGGGRGGERRHVIEADLPSFGELRRRKAGLLRVVASVAGPLGERE